MNSENPAKVTWASTTPFKTPYNKRKFQRDDEINRLPSMTVPDMTLSIPEIMRRYAQGLPIGGSHVPDYLAPDDDPDNYTGQHFDTLDLHEKHELSIRNKALLGSKYTKRPSKKELAKKAKDDAKKAEDNKRNEDPGLPDPK